MSLRYIEQIKTRREALAAAVDRVRQYEAHSGEPAPQGLVNVVILRNAELSESIAHHLEHRAVFG